jgi:zinc/manganese transport system ATP-binding protein
VTALLVAHDINPLIPYLDKVIYMANGNVASGPPAEVLTSESLTRLYGVHVEVLRDSRGNIVIVGGEDHAEGEIVGGEDHHEGEVAKGGYSPESVRT